MPKFSVFQFLFVIAIFSTWNSSLQAQGSYEVGDRIRFNSFHGELTGTINRMIPFGGGCMVDVDRVDDPAVPGVTLVMSEDIIGRVGGGKEGIPKVPVIKNRTWKSPDGKVTVVAELVDLTEDGDSVVLRKKSNSKEFTVSLDKLCEKDHLYLKPFMRARAAQNRLKAEELARKKERRENSREKKKADAIADAAKRMGAPSPTIRLPTIRFLRTIRLMQSMRCTPGLKRNTTR